MAVVAGVMTRCSLESSDIDRDGHTLRAHAAAQADISFSRATFAFGFAGSFADTRAMASTGQTSTHLPQPLQCASFYAGQKIGGADGLRSANFRAAISASQQHPQQLQMKATSFRTFSRALDQIEFMGPCKCQGLR